jgi:hypothetical protein
MIQFNRYRHADEPADFHQDIGKLVDLMTHGMKSCPELGIPLLFEMGEKYVGNVRLAAIAARLHFWRMLEWTEIEAMIPQELPKNWWFAQEIAGCLGFERVSRLWNVEEDDWFSLQGIPYDIIPPGAGAVHGHISYQPPNSGFFSVIENIIAAHIIAEQDGYSLKVDLSGNWWAYDEPFEDIFEDAFEFCNGGLPIMRFQHMRQRFFDADIVQAQEMMQRKKGWYNEVYFAIGDYASVPSESDVGTMFIRGGDKIKTETILPPMHIVTREMDWMKRHCRRRVLLSDDPVIADWIAARDPEIVNRANRLEGGYHHLPQRKQSCIPILQNYLAMVEAKHNFSCPSANLVNAAQWSREDSDNYSLTNPVYRYLLI